MTLTDVVIGKKYRNIHTNRVCIIRAKIFFNIKYYEFKRDPCELYPLYTHYKQFRKNWRLITV